MIRAIDVLLSIIGLIILFPFFVVITFSLFFVNSSPFFVQSRVGRYNQMFKLIKFRTLPLETPNVASHLISNDIKMHKLCLFLRKSKLDEIPQLINVLFGDMSLVGPRPCLPTQTDLIDLRTELKISRHLPGVTGFAQINNIDMSEPLTLSKFDLVTIEHLSVKNYFKWLLLTVTGKGRGDAAFKK